LQKFQQKARKQTKQKKFKSAEFLMEKEERTETEGIANPAFNISSTHLSASQTSEEDIIRHDKRDSTLAAHQQKLGLLAQAEPRGNECSRNYFDPLMDEEINPRQCGMEVSEEDERFLYEKLMTFLYEENSMMGPQGKYPFIHKTVAMCVLGDFSIHEMLVKEKDEGISDSARPVSYTQTGDLCEEMEDEETLPYIEHFDKQVQDEMITFDNFLLEQVRVKNQETT
ncbi:orofacial cleft 1 candidate gene 1 protein homolog, partial [Eublepharis macularius]|uniref:Orofacial cleft 1 candidate gene 1 protein homolog n=1 Tax=Eublepharis macularius TaxID=481883 RepID=A0AA97JPM7_EUBMA